MRLIIFLILIILSATLPAQSITNHLLFQSEDTTKVELNGVRNLDSDLATWVSGVNFQSFFDGVLQSWSIIADGKKAALSIQRKNATRAAMTLKADGQIGFGTSDPTHPYEFRSSSTPEIRLRNNVNTGGLSILGGPNASIINKEFGPLEFKIADSIVAIIQPLGNFITDLPIVSADRFVLDDGVGNRWDLHIGGSSPSCGNKSQDFAFSQNFSLKAMIDYQTGDYCNASDRRLKKNISPLANVKEKVMSINTYKYNYLNDRNDNGKSIGVMAQEVLPLFPELVQYHAKEDRYAVAYRGFDVIMVKALQERQKEIDLYKERIIALEELIIETKLNKNKK